MSQAYRSAYEHIVGTRVEALQQAREAVAPLVPELEAIRARRIARAVAGGVGLAGALVMILMAFATDDGSATYALLGSVGAALVTYAVTRLALKVLGSVPRFSAKGLLGAAGSPQLTGELHTDLAALDATDPQRLLQARVAPLEIWSTALPMAAISLLTPLTLHFAFVEVVSDQTATSFGRWISISLVIVGHAHLTLMGLAISFARRMKRSTDLGLAEMKITSEWVKAWGITIAVACVPGIILLLVPPVLSALTGVVFIPFLYLLFWRRVINERAVLARARADEDLRVAPAAEPVRIAPAEHLWSSSSMPIVPQPEEAFRPVEDLGGNALESSVR